MASQNFQRFTGKIALLTGSTYGIGYTVAERLAKEGAKVIISSRNRENVEKAAEKLRKEGLDVKGMVCHVSKPEERALLFKEAQKLGGLDIMMLNAGVNASVSRVLDTPETAWDKNFEVNVKSAYLLTREAFPLLKNSPSGRIIYMASVASFYHLEQLGAYAVSKLALMGLTKFVAKQVGQHNITVNCVAPGVIETRFSKVLNDDIETRDSLLKGTALKRFGTPEEVANVVAFLASDEASYVTGENVIIAGGLSSRI